MLEQVMEYFKDGYVVRVEDYYGDYQCDDEEEIMDAFMEDDFHSVTVEVDHEAHEVRLLVSDDE